MLKKEKLGKVNILLADADLQISHVLLDVMRRFGFRSINHVTDGETAIQQVMKGGVDLLITDWKMKPVDGIQLVHYLRQKQNVPNRAMPIIMLTARAERPDVEQARDAGITEFAVKPFSAGSIFNRIEQIVDNPRGTVFCPHYTGPDRRRRNIGLPDGADRRLLVPVVLAPHAVVTQKEKVPVMLAPDFSLRMKIGVNDGLSQLITSRMLETAQLALNQLRSTSMGWISEDMGRLERSYEMLADRYSPDALEQVQESFLTIKSRAGTFGHMAASSVAQLAYRFLRGTYAPGLKGHLVVILKHVQALKVIFATYALDEPTDAGADLIQGLEQLARKYG